MEKYKRFTKKINNPEEIQDFFDGLTTDGWVIIHYNEQVINTFFIMVTAVCKKTINSAT